MNYFLIPIYIILGFLPGLIWLAIFLWQDKKKPEPAGMVSKAFIWGMLITPPAVVIEFILIKILGLAPINIALINILAAFLIIAPTEEYLKYFIFKYKIFKSRAYDEPIDAMIYMITIAMGFASVENILLVVQNLEDPFRILLIRFLSATLLHALAAGLIGYSLGRLKQKKIWKNSSIAIGIFYAIIIHGLYDAMAYWQSAIALFGLAGLLILMTIIISFLFKKLKLTKSS